MLKLWVHYLSCVQYNVLNAYTCYDSLLINQKNHTKRMTTQKKSIQEKLQKQDKH